MKILRKFHYIEEWQCRVAINPESNFYIPVAFNIWGVAEMDHMHIVNHMNIIFHADHGQIMGVSIYPGIYFIFFFIFIYFIILFLFLFYYFLFFIITFCLFIIFIILFYFIIYFF